MSLLRGRLQEPGAASIEPGAEDPVDDAYQALWAPKAWMKPLRKDRAALAGQASAAAAKVESSPPPIPDPAAGAFFDVDNTLMRGASIYYFARGLAARKMFGPMDLARMAWGQACYRMRGAENADHIDAAREAALRSWPGTGSATSSPSGRRSTTTPWPTASGKATGNRPSPTRRP